MKNVHRLTAIFAVLTLTAVLLTGCQVTSPDDPEFRKDWDESMDEMQKEWDEAMDEAAKDWDGAMDDAAKDWDETWDAWKRDHKNGWTIEDGKDHYWKVFDGEEKEIGTVTDEEQVKALDDVLSDDGTWGFEEMEDHGKGAYSYVYCQEKTLLAGQDPDEEREYEDLVRFTVSASEDVVTMRILEDLPSLMGVDLSDYLTFSVSVPAETAEALRNPEQFTK